ncbi:nucleotide pyrophosphohydrolase [Microbacterium sp. NPDC057650]|uniref:nucleotide pyrophosphohydrolase n=1 Tax=unclassified Microbacterium TaxID=2609290 RepID=UPI003670F07C
MTSSTDRFNRLTEDVDAFARARGWQQSHNPKNLLLALVGEVGEVAEVLQWLTPEECSDLRHPSSPHREPLREELADVLIYLIELAANVDIDLIDAAQDKLVKNAIKHPAPTR